MDSIIPIPNAVIEKQLLTPVYFSTEVTEITGFGGWCDMLFYVLIRMGAELCSKRGDIYHDWHVRLNGKIIAKELGALTFEESAKSLLLQINFGEPNEKCA